MRQNDPLQFDLVDYEMRKDLCVCLLFTNKLKGRYVEISIINFVKKRNCRYRFNASFVQVLI